jgi:hypothetical protein
MTGHFVSLVFIMLVVGAGVINYFTLGDKQSVENGLLWRCIMLGVLMTFLVPFILSVLGSTLIVGSEGNPANFLNYVAICLAVAIVPRFFLVNVSSPELPATRSICCSIS